MIHQELIEHSSLTFNNVLIIKYNYNSFEKYVNKILLMNGCDVLSLSKYNEINISNIEPYLSRYLKIIIFDTLDIYLSLAKIVSRKKLFCFFWNTFNTDHFYKKLYFCGLFGNLYTFDENDSKKYHLKMNTQFFSPVPITNLTVKSDLYFVGVDKGRYELLTKLYNYMCNNQMNPFFQMLPDENKTYEYNQFVRTVAVDYCEVLRNVQESKSVLDISKPGQVGMTYRAVEALFFNKKIVTNNQHYKKLPFYSSDAIYIIEDTLDGLKEFIDGPKIHYSDEIRDYYSVENWLKRFKK